jgi:hypothetical protein
MFSGAMLDIRLCGFQAGVTYMVLIIAGVASGVKRKKRGKKIVVSH